MTGHISLYRKMSLVLRSEGLSEYDAAHGIHLPHYEEVGAATAVSQGQLQAFPDGSYQCNRGNLTRSSL